MDSGEDLKRFKAELKAPYPFIADPDGKLVKLFDVKTPVLSMSQRFTFVIGPERKVLEVQSGSDALDPQAAIQSCPVRKPKPAEPFKATPDAGSVK
jgi:thioredoxin-dependent peroxiredoxin